MQTIVAKQTHVIPTNKWPQGCLHLMIILITLASVISAQSGGCPEKPYPKIYHGLSGDSYSTQFAYCPATDAVIVAGNSIDMQVRDDYVSQPQTVFGLLLYFSGSQKALQWAKGIDIGDLIDEIAISPDGRYILAFTGGGTYLVLDSTGVIVNSLRHQHIDPFLSRSVRTVLFSSAYKIYAQQRVIQDDGQTNVIFFHFPYALPGGSSVVDALNFNMGFTDIYPLLMVFNSGESRIWMTQLVQNQQIMFNSYNTVTKSSDNNNKITTLPRIVHMSTISFALQYQAFSGDSSVLAFILCDNSYPDLNLLVGIEDTNPTIMNFQSFYSSGIPASIKILDIQVYSADRIYAASKDNTMTYLLMFTLTTGSFVIEVSNQLPSNDATGAFAVFKTRGAITPKFLMIFEGIHYRFMEADAYTNLPYQGIQVYSTEPLETYSDVGLTVTSTIPLSTGSLSVAGASTQFYGVTLSTMNAYAVLLTDIIGLVKEDFSASFPLYTPPTTVPEISFSVCMSQTVLMSAYLIDSYCAGTYAMTLADGSPLPSPIISYHNAPMAIDFTPGPLDNYFVHLLKQYSPVMNPAIPQDYMLIKLVGSDAGCLRFIIGSSLPNVEVYPSVPFDYFLPQLETGYSGVAVTILASPSWVSVATVGIDPYFQLRPMVLADLGINQPVTFYFDDGSILSPHYSFYISCINRPPSFDNGAPADIVVPYKVAMRVPIPSYSDPDGQVATLTVSPQPSAILTRNGDDFDIYCDDPGKIDTQVQFDLILQDNFGLTQTFTLSLFVQNQAPTFLGGRNPANVLMKIMDEQTVPLPAIIDDQGSALVTITHDPLPSFVTFDSQELTFTLKPTRFAHIGSFPVRITLQDELASTRYSFTIKVNNDPPVLAEPLKDQLLVVGTTSTYVIPSIYDPEGMPVDTWIEFENGVRPSFVTFNNALGTFTLLASEQYANTQWTVQLYFTDNISPPLLASFKISVYEDVESLNAALLAISGGISQNHQPSTAKIKTFVSIKITEIGRTGVVKLKFYGNSGLEYILQNLKEVDLMMTVQTQQSRTTVEYQIDSSHSNSLTLQTAYPAHVSKSSERDTLEIKVMRKISFEFENKVITLKQGTLAQGIIPPQISIGEKSIVEGFQQGIGIVQIASIPGGVVLNYFLQVCLLQQIQVDIHLIRVGPAQ